ncbi:MAG TPA: hypothetical protein VL330_26170 [Actinomycetes bacterium]|nr:hypothetical protein [Actinomycetes bacterium]
MATALGVAPAAAGGKPMELRLPHVLVPVSAGDLLLFAGVIALVVIAMRRRVAADGAGTGRETPPVATRQEGPGP